MLNLILNSRWSIPVIILLMVIVAWQFAISKTIQSIKLYSNYTTQIKLAENIPQQMDSIGLKMNSLNSIIYDSSLQVNSFQNLLLNEVSLFAKDNNIILTYFPESKYHFNNEFIIQTVSFSAQGSFKNLLSLVYMLEREKQIGRISSVEFNNTKDRKSGKIHLRLTAHVQLISKNDKEVN